MNSTIDINYWNLLMGYSLILIPILVFWYYKVRLIKQTIYAILRMTVQLLLVAVYLEFIFKLNNAWVNAAWVVIMLLLASYTTIHRSGLAQRIFFLPVLLTTLVSLVLVDAFFLGIVIRLDFLFESRYFIPISGILLGNTMRTNIIAMSHYFNKLKQDHLLMQFYLANGATRKEATVPFIREALKMAFNPTIANISVIGLITLPGVMTGQILGGSDPTIAIKYQIMFMISIFVSAMITVFLSLLMTQKRVFDEYDNLKNIFHTIF